MADIFLYALVMRRDSEIELCATLALEPLLPMLLLAIKAPRSGSTASASHSPLMQREHSLLCDWILCFVFLGNSGEFCRCRKADRWGCPKLHEILDASYSIIKVWIRH